LRINAFFYKEDAMSGELSTFEQKSAITPKQMPFSILGGTILAVIIFILVSTFGTNDAVDDLKKAEAKPAATQAATPAASGGEVDDI
jgi:zona occludens toxin (predicted ATPase)